METNRQRFGRAVAYANREFRDDLRTAVDSESAFDCLAAIAVYPTNVISAYRTHPWRQ